MRIAAALAFIASVLVMTPEAVSAMPLTLGDHAALSRHMSTTVMQVATLMPATTSATSTPRRAATIGSIIPIGGLTTITTGSITTRMAVRCFKCVERHCRQSGS
jgi:UPF0716 family protein affecting phage T7 exclusion